MKRTSATFFSNQLIILLFTFSAFCQQSFGQLSVQKDTLIVGVAGSAPFVIQDSLNDNGVAFEIWKDVATVKGWNYKVKNFKTVPEALSAVKKGNIDVLVGPVSITSERVKSVDFSQPYYYSGQGIMSRVDDPSIIDRISPLFSTKLFYALLGLIFVLFIVGFFIWMTEKKASPDQFPQTPLKGIGNGMWLAIVTMSTTGYGDRAPITFWGRILASAWMIISMIFSASLIAGIASSLTISGMGSNTITEASQLKGVKVATPSYDVVADFINENHAIPVEASSLEEAYQMLKAKKVDAIVFDRPQLLYLKQEKNDENIVVGKSYYEPAGYGFAFQHNKNSELIKELNVQMLNLNEVGKVKTIVNRWLGESK